MPALLTSHVRYSELTPRRCNVGRVWDDVISERDRRVYDKAGYGQHGGFAERPALLVVDVTYDFTGDRDEPILDSIDKFRNSCGEAAWASLPRMRELIAAARAKG